MLAKLKVYMYGIFIATVAFFALRLKRVNKKNKIKGMVKGLGGMFGIYFGLEEEPVNYRVIMENYDKEKILKFYREAYGKGLYFADYGGGPAHHGFSSAHSEKDIDDSLNRIEEICKKL